MGTWAGKLDPGALAGVHVLLVAPDDATRGLLASLLRYAGAWVVAAAAADEGLGSAATVRPDVVVTALAMSEPDGVAFVQLLRASADAARRIPVVGVTTAGGASERRRVMRAGFQAMMITPLDPHLLCGLIRQLTQPSRRR